VFPTYTVPIEREFLTQLDEKHDVSYAVFLADDYGYRISLSRGELSGTGYNLTADVTIVR